jgi:hypothetical protein
MNTLSNEPMAAAPPPALGNPFADNPALNELRSDLNVNVGRDERIASAVAGLVLLGAAHYFRHQRGWLRRLVGALLVSRGVTGHCPLYYLGGWDTRHYAKSAEGAAR